MSDRPFPPPKHPESVDVDMKRATVANVVSVAGYAATIGWLCGGSPWLGVAGIVADELDGYYARKLNQSSEYGSLLDWAIDLTLAGAIAFRTGSAWLLPVLTPIQVAMREEGKRPPILSARAVMTLTSFVKDGFKPLPMQVELKD